MDDRAELERHYRETVKPNYLRQLAAYQRRTVPLCEIEVVCKGTHEAVEIHHKRGRVGDLLTDEQFFVACCRYCHRFVERHREWAFANGFSERRVL